MIYNQTIEANKKKELPSLSFIKARKFILSRTKEIAQEKGFFEAYKNMNLEAKRQAVNDALKAIKNAILKHGKGEGISKLKFRSKKDPSQSLYVRQDCIGANVIFSQSLGPMKTSESFSKPKYDSRLVVKRNGHWNLNTPFEEIQNIIFKGFYSDNIVALDPGNRTFQTFYSPQIAGKIGADDKGRLFRLCLGCDKIQSKITKATGNRKRNLIAAYLRASTRIKNLVSEVHWKASRFLCSNFNTIILPVFESQSMVAKKDGKSRLNSKTCRQLLTWSHYTFQQRLKSKAAEMNSRVILTTEEYTSKTCPSPDCGKIHTNLGSSKIFKCPSCGIAMDRDFTGARNVLLRCLTLLESNNLSRLLRWEVAPS